MPVNTLVTWVPASGPSEAVQPTIADEILRLEAAGVNIYFPVQENGVRRRFWDTREEGQSWIDFLNSLEEPPESAVIVE